MDNIKNFRELFPIVNNHLYFDVATRAPLCKPVRRRIDEFLDDWQENGGDKEEWLNAVIRLRKKFAHFIGGSEHEIAITKNTSEGLNIVAAGLNWKHGDNVLVASEIEHPNNVYPWLYLKKHGVTVKTIETPRGFIDANEIIKLIDKRTRVVSISYVTFITGSVSNLKLISEICRKHSILLVVDAVQGLGTIPLNVHEMGIDLLSTSTHKRLLGLYGLGFFYCRKELLDQISPSYVARKSIHMKDTREFIMGDFDFELAPSANRYEIGNFNYLGVCAAESALDTIIKTGIDNIYKHIAPLGRYLRTSLGEMGFEMNLPYNEDFKMESGIISFRPVNPEKVYEKLSENAVKCSFRREWIRFSIHAYNTKDEVDKIVDMLKYV